MPVLVQEQVDHKVFDKTLSFLTFLVFVSLNVKGCVLMIL